VMHIGTKPTAGRGFVPRCMPGMQDGTQPKPPFGFVPECITD
jgi:hypothetical protein